MPLWFKAKDLGVEIAAADGTRSPVSEAYDRARVEQADAHADRILEVAERVLAGDVPADAGRVVIDAYRWTASKLRPGRYGERLDARVKLEGVSQFYELLTEAAKLQARAQTIDLEPENE
jgi:N-formylglutamate amidohydrolase